MYIYNNSNASEGHVKKNSRHESNFHIIGRGGTVEYVIRSAKERDPMEYIYGGAIQSSRYNHHKKKDYDNYMRSGSAVYMEKREKERSSRKNKKST
jgi:hypothetical protein